jgi:glucose dehydrogenase
MQFWAVVARQTAEEHSLKHRLACAAIAALSFALPIASQSDWTAYGHDAGQTKYSPLDQINTSNVDQLTQAWVYHMKPAAPAPAEPGTEPPYERTSPWGMYALFWDKDRFWPCQQPPWGQLWAINVNTGDVAWKVPFGTVPELDAKGVHDTGSLNYGGSISTGGGLVFIAASDDQHFRAYEAATGKILWDIKMDTGAYVTPSTFMGKDGKQYVVIVDTGGSFFDRTNGDSILAFALPSK